MEFLTGTAGFYVHAQAPTTDVVVPVCLPPVCRRRGRGSGAPTADPRTSCRAAGDALSRSRTDRRGQARVDGGRGPATGSEKPGTHSGSRTNRTDKFFPIGCPLVRTWRFSSRARPPLSASGCRGISSRSGPSSAPARIRLNAARPRNSAPGQPTGSPRHQGIASALEPPPDPGRAA
jgi:hypothetical protein